MQQKHDFSQLLAGAEPEWLAGASEYYLGQPLLRQLNFYQLTSLFLLRRSINRRRSSFASPRNITE